MVLARARALLAGVLYSLSFTAHATDDAEIVFLHLNDLHAKLAPHDDIVRTVDEEGNAGSKIESRGGLARIATAVFEQRRLNSNTVLMNIGDTFHGSAEALYSRGNALIEPLNALKIDVGVPGNWDFAYGPVVTRLRYSDDDDWFHNTVNSVFFDGGVLKPNYPSLAANVSKSFLFEDSLLMPATLMKKVGTTNIGFIGLTSNIVEHMSPFLARTFDFVKSEQKYIDLINTLGKQLQADGADLVVVMSELGLHQDYQLANNIEPGIDVFFSAHTHELTRVPLRSKSGALVVEAGNDAYLGKMTVKLSSEGSRTFDWNIIDIDSNIPEDPMVKRLVKKARAPFLADDVNFDHFIPNHDQPLIDPIDTVIARSPMLMHRRNSLSNPINAFLADRIREYYKADVAMTPGYRFDTVVPKGADITLEDLYRINPAPTDLARGEIRADDLRSILEVELERVYSSDAFAHKGGWMLGLSGLQLTVDLNKPAGERVIEMRDQDDQHIFAGNEMLSVVACQLPFEDSTTLCRHGGFLNIEKLPGADGKTWTALELLRYALSNDTFEASDIDRIKDLSKTPMWPQSDLLQPIR